MHAKEFVMMNVLFICMFKCMYGMRTKNNGIQSVPSVLLTLWSINLRMNYRLKAFTPSRSSKAVNRTAVYLGFGHIHVVS